MISGSQMVLDGVKKKEEKKSQWIKARLYEFFFSEMK